MARLAGGVGKVVASCKVDVEPAIITLECDRLPADGTDPAGGPDTAGFDLHVRYESSRPMLLDRSDDGRSILVAEFDAQRVLILPKCGEIQLIGGRGLYRWSIGKPEKWNGNYTPQWRTLTRFCTRSTDFTIPDGHTEIGALNANVAIVAADGDAWLLDGSPKPVSPGSVFTPGGPVRVFTRIHL